MTITCASDRSGIASRLMLNAAQTPAMTSMPVNSSTRKRLRTENSMILAIMDDYADEPAPDALFVRPLKKPDQLIANTFESRACAVDVFCVGELSRRFA